MKKITLLILGFLIIGSLFVAAGDNLTGEEILDQLKDETGLTGSGTATINLITENKKGEQRSNKLGIFRKDDAEFEKQLLEYIEPADVKGTKFLSINNTEKDENQMWLYLPVLGRERRIAGHMTKDKFMSTDFTYEEIGGGNSYQEDYQAERLEDEEFAGYLSYVLDLTPEAEDSDYSRVKMWVWQEEMKTLQIEFYNQDEQLSKCLIFRDFKENDDGEFTPHMMIMSDELSGTRTIIEIMESNSQEVDDEYFSMRYLRK